MSFVQAPKTIPNSIFAGSQRHEKQTVVFECLQLKMPYLGHITFWGCSVNSDDLLICRMSLEKTITIKFHVEMISDVQYRKRSIFGGVVCRRNV